MANTELKVKDGRLYVVYTDTLSTPVEVETWWDLNVTAMSVSHRVDLDERIPLTSQGGGSYLDHHGRWWVLPGGGSQLPAFTVKRDLPAPKLRAEVPTRWNRDRGQWEKYLKTRGWVRV